MSAAGYHISAASGGFDGLCRVGLLAFTMDLFPAVYICLAEMYAKSFWASNLFTAAKLFRSCAGSDSFGFFARGQTACLRLKPANIQFVWQLGIGVGGDSDSYQISGFNGMEAHRTG